jgi:hypothetical protein
MFANWVYRRGWIFWLVVIVVVFIILWIVVGGREYKFVGVAPLFDASEPLPQSIVLHEEPSKPSQPEPFPDDYPDLPTETIGESISDVTEYLDQSGVDATPIIPSAVINEEDNPFFTKLRYKPQPTKKKYKQSKGEEICCQTLEQIYGVPFERIRPNWLKNPETGANLEIDCYNHDLRLGVEYNGQQHYVWPNFTGQSYQDFLKQVRRDKFKVDTCDANGVYLITVPYNVPHKLIPKFIQWYLPEAVAARLENGCN